MVTALKPIQVDASAQHLNMNVARKAYVQNVLYVIRQAVTSCFARLFKLLKAVNKDRVWGGGGGNTDVSEKLSIFRSRPAHYSSFRKLLPHYTASHPAIQ
jgi:hypothetical protein